MVGPEMSADGFEPIAIVGVSAILPDAPDADRFWDNVSQGRYSISEVDPDRWDPDLYFDPDPSAPERTYSKIGGWVRDWEWDPLGWHLPIPPRVSDAMDDAQKWGVAGTRMALLDYGWPERPIDLERTAVVLGNAMAGEKHYLTSLRVAWPALARELERSETYAGLPEEVRSAVAEEMHHNLDGSLPPVTEDTMPGELSNCLAGRIANLFNLRGPNYVVDAACASAMAAIDASVEGLIEGDYDAVVTGGIDRNMGASTFIKFCAIGALSATGTRPYADGADGFVMGEGAALFVLKRLADAERDGDRVYAVIRSIAGSSDGKGKGITAPNPVGQRLAVQRAWQKSGLDPAVCSMVEGHGTSTRVGDVVEISSLTEAFAGADLAPGSVALGSVKSNIGHLKAAAGAAGILKTALALHHGEIPPSLNFERPNPNVEWAESPFAVNTERREWEARNGDPRLAAVSAFGFGGTNFHAVLEEHVPGRLTENGGHSWIAVSREVGGSRPTSRPQTAPEPKRPLRGALVLGARDAAGLQSELEGALADAKAGSGPPAEAPSEAVLRAPERLAIDYGDADELAQKAALALRALQADDPAAWKALRARGVFRGGGPPGKVAFLYTGQGSQYANMLGALRRADPIVAETFAEADRVMRPLLDGQALSDFVFVDPGDSDAMQRAEQELMRTEITQPAVMAVDIALTRLLGSYGVVPDFVMGHSLGEYSALVAAGVLSFEEALEAVSARGHEMASLEVEDPGAMVAAAAPLEEIEEIIAATDGYAVIANMNSSRQVVIGGATEPVEAVLGTLTEGGHQATRLPVSHAFHTEIVAPAAEPLGRLLRRLQLSPPEIPVVANVDGEFYPGGPGVEERLVEILCRQISSPVQFVKGLRTLFEAGARVFVESGPKRALATFAADVLGDDEVLSLFANHPKSGDLPSFNQALCGLYASGLGTGRAEELKGSGQVAPPGPAAPPASPGPRASAGRSAGDTLYLELGHMFSDFLERGREVWERDTNGGRGDGLTDSEPVTITGASVGIPGTNRVFEDDAVARLLHGEQFIDVIPTQLREEILDKHITRLVKGEDGTAEFVTIDSPHDVIKLAARAGELDLAEEFGVDKDRLAALGRETQLAIGAGIDALRDAGIPLALHYKTTTQGTKLPDRWALPEEMRDDTAIIFASAFPGLDDLADEMNRYWADRGRREQLHDLESLRTRLAEADGAGGAALEEIDRRIHDLRLELEQSTYRFDRRFLFRVLSMGHSQLAELIGARGPNTQLNAACASTTQAVAVAEDWIRTGRCRRAVIVAADDVTSSELLPWIGSGFLASGAAATDEAIEEAALPFDRRRHGMLLGMGAAALVVESAAAARERGIRPICEVLGVVTANSAFHGTRLDVEHIGEVMEEVVRQAEARGETRADLAREAVFVSHETYTPARGGSAAAEIHALRQVFGRAADHIVIANSKGFTGHPMGVGIEDVVAVKALETGIVPPVPNFEQVDPELGELHLSRGGSYPVRYALRLAAGFGSQISMMLLRWTPVADGRHRNPEELGFDYRIADRDTWRGWLSRISGQQDPQLEVEKRRLRVVDRGPTGAPTVPAGATAVPLGAPEASPPAAAAPPEPSGPPAPPAPAARAEPAQVVPPPPPAPTLEPPPEAEPAPGATAETVAPSEPEVKARILGLVAEETGYPADMLDPELDLEADLGIDTVKQAEVFAAIRELYGIERDDSLKLRDYPTLNHVVGFVLERAPGAAIEEDEDAEDQEGGRRARDESKGDARFSRRVPVPVVRPPLDRCVPTGVELESGSRVILMPDQGGVGAALAKRLSELGVEVLELQPDLQPDELDSSLAALIAQGPINGVYWLPALDREGPVATLERDAWRDGIRIRVKLLAATMRALAEHVSGSGTFLVSATRLGGRHGYDAAGTASAMGGAVAGFTKALAREREQMLAKVVDFAPSRKTAALAQLLIDETLHDPGAVEVGYADDLRWTVGLAERPAEPSGPELSPETTFLVTGAAGSIVSAITADLASASGGTFHLLDLVPQPDPDDPDLERLASDREGLQRDLAGRIQERGERPTPKLVERELARIERAAAALRSLEAIRAVGGTAHWHQVDLTDADKVGKAVAAARADGEVDVLIHAAGLEVSHFLPDKPQAEYDLVFDVKVDGWFNLLHALRDAEVGSAVVFSSIAARFGNAGQTDYSAANDLLCKSVLAMRSGDSVSRGIAIDWTAWAEIGMATRGSIPKMMEMAGIDMLPPAIGVPVVRRELTAAGAGGEVLVAGALGVMLEERHPTGGLDAESANELAAAPPGPMTGRIAGMSVGEGLKVLVDLDPSRQAFLHDHRIDGVPVLPGVMGIEAFAEAATVLLPEWHVAAVEQVDLLAPVKFYGDEPRTLEIRALLRDGGDGALLADCMLIGRRELHGQGERETLHFTGRVRLTREATAPLSATEGGPAESGDHPVVDRDAVYRVYFHGPAYQVLERAWRSDGAVFGKLAEGLPPDHEPPGQPMHAEPRLIELCFQTAGVYELGRTGRMALPTHIDRVRIFEGEASEPLFAVVRPGEADMTVDAEVVDAAGRLKVRLEGYRTTELPGEMQGDELEQFRRAMA
jgi:acyl transferase domain-containing protein/acyl carrier protein